MKNLAALVLLPMILVAACSGATSLVSGEDGRFADLDTADIEAAIASGDAYLAANTDSTPPLLLALIDYLHRAAPEFVDEPDLSALRELAETDSQARVFLRVADPGVTTASADVEAQTDEVDVLTAPALYCDRFGLPADYADRIERATATGGYELTHAGLADAIAVELGCLTEDEIAPRSRRQTEALAALVLEAGPASDLGMEAIAILFFTGRAAAVEPEWISEILAAELPGGGWANTPEPTGDQPANPHATAMAIWALLGVLGADGDQAAESFVAAVPTPGA